MLQFVLIFYRTHSFVSTENGNHCGITNPDQEAYKIIDASFFHFNNTGINRLYERAITICAGYKYLELSKPFNYINSKQNYNLVRKIWKNNIVTCGNHRFIQLASMVIRYYIFSLFQKYSTDEYFNPTKFYKFLYDNSFSHSEIINTVCNSFSSEFLHATYGNDDFLTYRLEDNADVIEKRFIDFFGESNKNKITNTLTIEQIFKTDEFDLRKCLISTQPTFKKGNLIRDFLLSIPE